MKRCCAKCFKPISIYESQGYTNRKVLHLACVEFSCSDIIEPLGPLATDNVEEIGGTGDYPKWHKINA